MKFRKKPVVIDAVQFDGTLVSLESLPIPECSQDLGSRTVQIHTLEGVMTASPGDWIIRGVKGEFYPCKPEIFAATYEAEAAPPVAAPGASIAEDNVFVHALSALTKSSVLVPWTPEEQAFIDCVDAKLAQHGYQQFEAGLMTAEKTLKSNGKAMETALNDAEKEKSRAEAAEASLARLVEGIEGLTQWRSCIAEYNSGESLCKAETSWIGRRVVLHADLSALLPAKADKPKGCTGTPACCPDNEGYGCACTPIRTTSDAAYESLTPERRKKLDSEILLLEQRMQEHRRSRERRQHVVPVAVERRIADARGSGVHQDRNKD